MGKNREKERLTEAMSKVKFRFYEELNNHLAEEKRKGWFEFPFSGVITVKEAIQTIGVPPEEIDLILVNQQSQGFEYFLQNGDQISVFPEFERLDISGVSKLREKPLRNPGFICDVHLGRLSKYLRMFGFDTMYSNQFTPKEIVSISIQEKRILLSRNYQLVKQKEVTHSFWVRSADPTEQVNDLILQLDLSGLANPLTRCLICNNKLETIEKELIIDRLQPGTEKYYNEFFICPTCDHIYWKGSHFEDMLEFINHFTHKK